MGFALKKFVSFWLMPLPFCLTLSLVGLALLFSRKRVRLGRTLIAVSLLLLLLLGNGAVSIWLMRPLESIYPPVPELIAGEAPPEALTRCGYIVVLGGGHTDSENISSLSKLSSAARSRIAEGVRLAHALPEARLVVSGHGEPGMPTHAAILADAAVSLGIDPSRIVALHEPRDTHDEARLVAALVGDTPFALVTSAGHLRRATALMKRAGANPVPCPCDFSAWPRPTKRWRDYLQWDAESLVRSTAAIYERLGYTWARLRGQV